MLGFRRYPSITSMQCFECAARHLSFTRAAQELHMTQSAVSKQVAQLEDMLKLSLFQRTSQSLYLTPAGKKYYIDVQKILSNIELATTDVMAHGMDTETLNIISHPTFCARWLIPALKGFSHANPDIHLDIKERANPFFSEDTDADITFLYGDGVWANMESIKLFDEQTVAVCRPDYLKAPLTDLKQMSEYVLLQTSSRASAWYNYFEKQQVDFHGTFVGPRFDTFYACITGAELGCGIALVPKNLVENELQSGKLVLAWNYIYQGTGAYYLSYMRSKASTHKVKTMVDWILTYLDKEKKE